MDKDLLVKRILYSQYNRGSLKEAKKIYKTFIKS